MSDHITVTGNEAQFNENVTFLKNVFIGEGLDIHGVFNSHGNSNLNDVHIEQNLQVEGPTSLESLYVTGVATFTNTVNFNETLSFNNLEIRDRLNVGVGGTVFTADSRLNPGKVGIGSTQPTELLDVLGKAKILDLELRNLLVTGISTFQDDIFIGVGATVGFGTTAFFQDGAAAIFGTQNALSIYHADGNSYIDDIGPGSIFYRSGTQTFQNAAGTKTMAVFNAATSVDLNYNNVLEFSTIDGGVYIPNKLGIGTEIPLEVLHINSNDSSVVVTAGGTVGMGTTNPYNSNVITELDNSVSGPLRLAVDGSISISRNIYDSAGSPGGDGDYLHRDGTGIRWISTSPEDAFGIIIRDEGQDIPIVGTAQTFDTIDFRQKNSFGLGVDNIVPTAQATPGTGIASITSYDFWGFNDDDDIYRMTNVGIGTTIPVASLDIREGNLIVSAGSSIGIGTTNPNTALDVRGDIRLDSDGGTDRSIYFRNQSDGGGVIKSDKDLSLWSGILGSPTRALTVQSETLNIGIGTTNPQYKLHIKNTTGSSSLYLQSSDTSDTEILFGGITNLVKFRITYNNDLNSLSINGYDDIPTIYINSDTEVGIGTTNPNYKLDVYDGTTEKARFGGLNDQALYIGSDSDEAFIANDFQVLDQYKGEVIKLRTTDESIRFSTSDTEKVIITSTGDVGINTVTPQAMLDVRGNTIIGIDQVSGNPGTTVGITTIRGHHVNSDGDYAQLYLSNSKSAGGGTAPTASIRAGRETNNYGTNLSFWTNSTGSAGDGSERLRIASDGRVGINTNVMSNFERLAVQLGNDDLFELRSAAQELFQVWKESSTEEARLNIKHDGLTKIHLRGNGVSYFNGGDVGIGSTQPKAKLDVNGSFNVAGISTFNDDAKFIGTTGNALWDSSKSALLFDDYTDSGSVYLGFGADEDLRIFSYDGNAYIESFGTSNLNLRTSANGQISLRAALGAFGEPDDEVLANFIPNSKVELFFDGESRFETSGMGVTVTGVTSTTDLYVTGVSTFVGIATFNDQVKFDNPTNTDKDILWDPSNNRLGFSSDVYASFGDDFDLQILHDGNDGNNFIKSTLTNLNILSRKTLIRNANNTEDIATFNSSGSVDLYYANNKRFQTSGIGVTVTGITSTTHLYVTGVSTFVGFATFKDGVYVTGVSTFSDDIDADGDLDVDGHTELDDLNVSGISTFVGISTFKDEVGIAKTLTLGSHIKDVNDDIGVGVGKTDWRLSSVGTGVSWRPSGVQTKRTIWVTKSGNDSNSGLLEGDAKATIGAAASIAVETDTIKVRPGVYFENNPVGLRTDVSVTGEDLRLVTVIPNNPLLDVFAVRNGCLVENLNFVGLTTYTSHKNAACVAFPEPAGPRTANTGYLEPGPFVVPVGKRYKSPYVRNCTNFMCDSIGMKIDGNNATAASFGSDLKSMVCDSFTQYNENGIGVSITNDGYAQLVSIFTINCDIGIFCGSGGQCDLTNSNSSFGNFGLVAVGLGSTQFTGIVSNTNAAGDLLDSTNADQQDTVTCADVFDNIGNPRRPFDGQSLFFKINLDNYPDVQGTGTLTTPLRSIESIKLLDGVDLTGFSALDPPSVVVRDADGTLIPKGPQGIPAQASATIGPTGNLVGIDVIASGRNYLPSQNLVVDIEGNTGLATVVSQPIYYTIESASKPTNVGLCTLTFNEFVPYELFPNDGFSLKRISRILTSSHSFEYVGTGTDINTSTPLQGAIPIKDNEIVASDGAQIPFTSTDQQGNFDIGQGIQINQTTSTITGRDFSRAIQAEVTPLILALR